MITLYQRKTKGIESFEFSVFFLKKYIRILNILTTDDNI